MSSTPAAGTVQSLSFESLKRVPLKSITSATAVTNAARAPTRGQSPAFSPVREIATKKKPNPIPAPEPSRKAFLVIFLSFRTVPGSEVSSAIAGIATSTPSQPKVPGRSPKASPNITGSAVPTRAAVGETTAVDVAAIP